MPALRRARVAELRAAGWTIPSIAVDLGVTERTVSRHVTALGIAHEPPAHGMSRRYDEGCRCDACREAGRAAGARRRERRREEGVPGSRGSRLSDDQAVALARVHAADQERTRAAATRAYREWTDADLAVALDPRLSTTQAAETLRRSRASVAHVRARNPGWRTR